jgi:hypothetical protein
VAAIGCSFFTSLDGFSDGAAPVDAGAGTDAPVTTDSGADGNAGDAAKLPFCASQTDARLCESFDEAPLPGTFDSRSASGAEATLDSVLSASPPSSLSVVLASEAASLEHYGGVTEELTPGPSRLTVSLKLHVVKVPTVRSDGPRADMLSVVCRNANG